MSEYEPKVVCYSCRFGWGYLTDEGELSPEINNWIPIVCSGKIDASYIFEAFKRGADGVLILGCPEGDCHYQDGNFEMRKKLYIIQKMMEACGIAKERLRLELSSDPEGKRIAKLAREMSKDISKLGPLKKSGIPAGVPVATTKARGG